MQWLEHFWTTTGHEYAMAFYGVIGWYLLIYSIARNAANNKLTFKEWRDKNKDEILVTVWIAPLLVVYDDELIGLLHSEGIDFSNKFHNLVYLLAGPVTDGLYRLVTLFKTRKNSNH